jgi:hypothetical protein
MLRDDEESFNLNQLWVVQGRLFIVSTAPLSTVEKLVASLLSSVSNGCF